MLVFASDLHLTDGTTCANVTPDAFYLFTDRIRDMAYRASWRAGDTYQPIEQLDVVLLGDIFDLLHSTRWTENGSGSSPHIHPWDDADSPAFQKTIAAITDGIIEHNAPALEVLKRLSEPGRVQVSSRPNQPSGRPRKMQDVAVRVFSMTGNHDWYYHLPGAAYDAIRSKIIAAAGLSNPITPFPYTPEELPELAQTLQAHSVYARHGDFYDTFNYEKSRGRDASALGDAVAVLLIDRFPSAVQAELGDQLSPECIAQLREIVNVRPALLVPTWIDSLLRQNCDPHLSDQVKTIWNDLANDFMHDPFVRSFDRRLRLDAVDALEAVLTISKSASFDTLSNLMAFVTRHFWGGNVSFAKNALQEKAFQDHSARFVVYGHTHHQEVTPLDVYKEHNVPLSEICFNTGTWHALHTATEANPSYVNFVSYYTMTIATFFKGSERRGKPYETWTGTLGWD
jgi:UDP-2,3-diacylglucosamine pyrophosphatase LpxH